MTSEEELILQQDAANSLTLTALIFLVILLTVVTLYFRFGSAKKVTVTASTIPAAGTSPAAPTTTPPAPTTPSQKERITKALWFFGAPSFWLIVLTAVLVIIALWGFEIITTETFSRFEFTTGLKLAVLLIFAGIAFLLLSIFLGKLLIVLGFVALLLGTFFPDTLSWLDSNDSNDVTTHKRLEVNIPADGRTELFYNNDPAKCLLPIFERPEAGLPVRVLYHPDYGVATYEQMAELQNRKEPRYQSIAFAGNGKSYRVTLEWRKRGQCT